MATSENGLTPGQAFRARRVELDMRQADVAEKAACAVSRVCQVELGYTPKNLGRLEPLAAAVGASVGSFWPCSEAQR